MPKKTPSARPVGVLIAEELVAALGVFVLAKLDAEHARSTGLVDEMTGVYNIRGLSRRAEELAAHAARCRTALGCVFLSPDTEAGAVPLALVRRIAAALRSAESAKLPLPSWRSIPMPGRCAASRGAGLSHRVHRFRRADLRATAALQNARTDQPDAWLQQYH
jgi:hypothetical protein